MRTYQVNISEEAARQLETIAKEQGVSAEDFVRRVTEEIVNQPKLAFEEVADLVLAKNQELYRRLAT